MVNFKIAHRHGLCVSAHSPRSHWKYVNKLPCYFRNNLYIIRFLNNRAWKITLMLYLPLEIVSEVPIIGVHTCSLIEHIYLWNTFITFSTLFVQASTQSHSPFQGQSYQKLQGRLKQN